MLELLLGIFIGVGCCYGICYRRTRRQLNALEYELNEIRQRAPRVEGDHDFFRSKRQVAEFSNSSYLEVLLRKAHKIKHALDAKPLSNQG